MSLFIGHIKTVLFCSINSPSTNIETNIKTTKLYLGRFFQIFFGSESALPLYLKKIGLNTCIFPNEF